MSPDAAAGFSYPALVDEIRRSGVSLVEISKITRVGQRQVQHWMAGTSRPSAETRDRLVDIHYIVRQLSGVYRPEGIEIWLHARNAGLGGKRPIELLIEGRFQPVVEAVDRLAVGAM